MTKQEKIEQAKALHCEGFSAIEISRMLAIKTNIGQDKDNNE